MLEPDFCWQTFEHWLRRGCIELTFRSNYYDSTGIYSKPIDLNEIDCYAVFSPEMKGVYYFRVDEISQEMIAIALRIEPTKNGQDKRVWWAKDFSDPRRIAPRNIEVPSACREVSERDEQAIAEVIAYLVE